MNNDLEQFSEERLIEIANFDEDAGLYPSIRQCKALARIALSVKQAKPEYHIVRLDLNDAWGRETVLNAYESQLDASKCKDDHGGGIIPCYTTPQPAHTEQVIPSEIPKVPHNGGMAYKKGGSIYSTNYARGWNDCVQNMLAAAPKPESE